MLGIPRFNKTLPPNATPAGEDTESALSKYNVIQGETASVFNVSGGLGNGLFVLTRFPIAKNGTDPATAVPYAPSISRDVPLQDVRVASDGTLDFTKAKDADGASFPLTNFTTGSMVYVSYRYKDAATNVWGITQEPVPVTLGITGLVVHPPTTGVGAAAASGVVPEPVDVTLRQFLGVGSFETSAGDPQGVSEARRGLVKMPTGATAGDVVSVDYVADWSYLVQDGVPTLAPPIPDNGAPPAENIRQLALGAPFIEDQTSIGIYSLLLEPGSTGFTAKRSAFGTLNPSPPATDGLIKPTEEDLRAGRATFEVTVSGSRARVVYQTRDNWAEQLSVAAMAYKPYSPVAAAGAAAAPIEPWRDYVLGTDNYLYFHASEAGKSIAISFKFNDSTGEQTVVARPFVISEELIDRPVTVPAALLQDGATKVSRLELTDGDGVAVTPTSIQSVIGTSVTVRTAYMNGSRYAQVPVTTNISRSLDQ